MHYKFKNFVLKCSCNLGCLVYFSVQLEEISLKLLSSRQETCCMEVLNFWIEMS
jgi:hypothetical protein